MKPRHLLLAVIVMGGAVLAPNAHAGTAGFTAGHFTFTAAPGEANAVIAETTTSCESLPAPCFSFSDSPFYGLAAPPGCVEATVGGGIRCPLPAAVTIDVGDALDFVIDWDGPSTIRAGDGEDVIRGLGGDDVLAGETGADTLIGGPGNDALDGGPGEDTLESYISGLGYGDPISPAHSAGTDALAGGPGTDTVSYQARTDPLSITIDGDANDGAPGERDNVAADVEAVVGGEGDDAITGGGGRDVLAGMEGRDTLVGGPDHDELDGGVGDDTLLGGDGPDEVSGGGDHDVLDGGADRDQLYGEYAVIGCALQGCLPGSDEIRARDGSADFVDCGEAADRALLDQFDATLDAGVCESVEVSGAAAPAPEGAKRASCSRVSRAMRPICRVVSRAVTPCVLLPKGRRLDRCLKRAMRRGSAACKARFRGRKRAACVRSVRRVVYR
jgi:hypothetical protein